MPPKNSLLKAASRFVDSCAIPGHPMIENVWRDRIKVADVMIAPKSISVKRFAMTLKTKDCAEQRGKLSVTLYNFIRGRKRS